MMTPTASSWQVNDGESETDGDGNDSHEWGRANGQCFPATKSLQPRIKLRTFRS